GGYGPASWQAQAQSIEGILVRFDGEVGGTGLDNTTGSLVALRRFLHFQFQLSGSEPAQDGVDFESARPIHNPLVFDQELPRSIEGLQPFFVAVTFWPEFDAHFGKFDFFPRCKGQFLRVVLPLVSFSWET